MLVRTCMFRASCSTDKQARLGAQGTRVRLDQPGPSFLPHFARSEGDYIYKRLRICIVLCAGNHDSLREAPHRVRNLFVSKVKEPTYRLCFLLYGTVCILGIAAFARSDRIMSSTCALLTCFCGSRVLPSFRAWAWSTPINLSQPAAKLQCHCLTATVTAAATDRCSFLSWITTRTTSCAVNVIQCHSS